MLTRSPPSSPLQEPEGGDSPLDRSFELSKTNSTSLLRLNTPKPSPKTNTLFPRFGGNSPPLSSVPGSETTAFVHSSAIPHLELTERKTPTLGPITPASESGLHQTSKLSSIIENDPKYGGTPSMSSRVFL